MTEEQQVHTRLLKCALAEEQALVWWERSTPTTTAADAFNELWWGSASEARVRVLVTNMRARFPPDRVQVLRALPNLNHQERAWVGLWHLMLADPIARQAAGDYLPSRRRDGFQDIRKEGLVDWVRDTFDDRWSGATRSQFGSKLLGVFKRVGLIEGIRGPRPLRVPPLSDRALTYLLYTLRESEVTGELDDNPYLRALGLSDDDLLARLSSLTAVRYRRVGDIGSFEWKHPTALSWAQETA